MIPTGFTVTLSTKLYFGLTTTVISEQQSNIIPEFWRNKISERVFNDAVGSPWRFTCNWHYPWMIYLHLIVPSDDLLAFDFTLGWFTCIWLYSWMIYLHLTSPLDDVLAFGFTPGWFTCIWLPLDDLLAFDFTPGWLICIWLYPWMIYLHWTLPLDDLLAFDFTSGWFTWIWHYPWIQNRLQSRYI